MQNIFLRLKEKLLGKKELLGRVKFLEEELKQKDLDFSALYYLKEEKDTALKVFEGIIEEKVEIIKKMYKKYDDLSVIHEKEMDYLGEVKLEKYELQKKVEQLENDLKRSEPLKEINKMLINRNRRLKTLMKRKKPKVA